MNTIKVDNQKVKMIAHRGLSGLERENTCSAFVAAGNRSYFGIETDIHRTVDGEYVIIHDETTTRVSENKYSLNVEENSYPLLKDIVLPDIDGSFNRIDLRLPRLIDYIKICKKYEKIAVLELKNRFEEEHIKEVIEIIKGEDYLDKVIFISFSFDNCKIVRKLLPAQDVQWLLAEEITDKILGILDEYRLNLDTAYQAIVSKEVVEKVHKLGLTVNCWTCDNKETAEKLIEYGVDYITTNILE